MFFTIGDVVRKLREQNGWGVIDVAMKAGVDKGTVSDVENDRNYTKRTLTLIAAVFKETPEGLARYLAPYSPDLARHGVPVQNEPSPGGSVDAATSGTRVLKGKKKHAERAVTDEIRQHLTAALNILEAFAGIETANAPSPTAHRSKDDRGRHRPAAHKGSKVS